MKRAFTLLIIYLIACVFDYGAHLSFLIRYFLMALLFFSFLKIEKIGKPDFKRVFYILTSMFLIGFSGYFIFVGLNNDLALSVFMIALTPTALGSIVIIDILGGNQGQGASNVLFTNIIIVFILPFLIYLIGKNISLEELFGVISSTLITFFIPFIFALMLRNKIKRTVNFISRINLNFYLWAVLMFLSISKSAYFLKYNETVSSGIVIMLLVLVLLLCVLNFTIGKLIGNREYGLEFSLALGHKNNGFSVWFCLTYINPFVALGPAVYVLFQNFYLILLLGIKKRR